MLPVDGFSVEINEVFEFQGCRYHGHAYKLNPNHEDEEIMLRRKKIEEKKRCIEKSGYKFVWMWECEFNQLKKTNHKLLEFTKEMKHPLEIKQNLLWMK